MANIKTLRRSAQVKFKAMRKRWNEDGHIPVCVYCGTYNNITVDHVVPIILGGNSDRNNLAPCCYSCNQKKGKLLWEPMYRKTIKWGDASGQ